MSSSYYTVLPLDQRQVCICEDLFFSLQISEPWIARYSQTSIFGRKKSQPVHGIESFYRRSSSPKVYHSELDEPHLICTPVASYKHEHFGQSKCEY